MTHSFTDSVTRLGGGTAFGKVPLDIGTELKPDRLRLSVLKGCLLTSVSLLSSEVSVVHGSGRRYVLYYQITHGWYLGFDTVSILVDASCSVCLDRECLEPLTTPLSKSLSSVLSYKVSPLLSVICSCDKCYFSFLLHPGHSQRHTLWWGFEPRISPQTPTTFTGYLTLLPLLPKYWYVNSPFE